jgi:hypothetical protein
MHYRCLVCPGPGVSEIRPGRAAGRTTRRCATVLSANPAGRAAQLLAIAPARYPDRSAGGPPREPAAWPSFLDEGDAALNRAARCVRDNTAHKAAA